MKNNSFKSLIDKCIKLPSTSKDFQNTGNLIADSIESNVDFKNVSEVVFNNILKNKPSESLWKITEEIIEECIKDLSNNIYHTPIHIGQVVAFSHILICKNSDLFTSEEQLLMLWAALGHDLCHDGTNHVNKPFYLEAQAAQKTKSILLKYGISEEKVRKVENLILMTDSSIRHQIYLINHNKFNMDTHEILGKMEKKDVFLGGLLADADMFCSIGLGFKQHVKQTILVAKEMAFLNQTSFNGVELSIVRYFLDEIIGNKFCSPTGNDFLYSLEKIKDIVESQGNSNLNSIY